MNEVLLPLIVLAAMSMMFGIMDAILGNNDSIVFGGLMLWLKMNIIGKIILFVPLGFFCLLGFIGYFLMIGFKVLIFMKF